MKPAQCHHFNPPPVTLKHIETYCKQTEITPRTKENCVGSVYAVCGDAVLSSGALSRGVASIPRGVTSWR
jgi:hypothetical protein